MTDPAGRGVEPSAEKAAEATAQPQAVSAPSTSLRLFLRAKRGEQSAIEALFRRLLPSLTRWARGRLPRWGRARMDTDDLVQEAFAATFRRLPRIEPRRKRAIRAYLRQSIRNKIRDELDRAGKVETSEEPPTPPVDQGASPLDRAISVENEQRFLRALERLSPGDQQLIVGRIQLDYNYEQLALATGKASPDAARVAVRRALLRLAQEMSLCEADDS